MTYAAFDMLTIRERLEEFVRRMNAAPACSSFTEAFDLLGRTLIEIEDAFSGIAYDAAYPRDDGRMYPPKEDARREVPGRTDLQCFRSKQHRTYFSEEGAILIADLKGHILLDKSGSDGRSIGL